MTVKENVKNQEVWLRGLFILVFGAILYFTLILVCLVCVFQFASKLLTGTVNRPLDDFSTGLLHYTWQLLSYVTFQLDEKPFPFASWPTAEKAGSKPRSRRRHRGGGQRPAIEEKDSTPEQPGE